MPDPKDSVTTLEQIRETLKRLAKSDHPEIRALTGVVVHVSDILATAHLEQQARREGGHLRKPEGVRQPFTENERQFVRDFEESMRKAAQEDDREMHSLREQIATLTADRDALKARLAECEKKYEAMQLSSVSAVFELEAMRAASTKQAEEVERARHIIREALRMYHVQDHSSMANMLAGYAEQHPANSVPDCGEKGEGWKRFRKRPVVIQAMQFTGHNCRKVLRAIGRGHLVVDELKDTDSPVIPTLEGDMTASPGDWIVRGVKGEFYPVKPDIFSATYDPDAPENGTCSQPSQPERSSPSSSSPSQFATASSLDAGVHPAASATAAVASDAADAEPGESLYDFIDSNDVAFSDFASWSSKDGAWLLTDVGAQRIRKHIRETFEKRDQQWKHALRGKAGGGK